MRKKKETAKGRGEMDAGKNPHTATLQEKLTSLSRVAVPAGFSAAVMEQISSERRSLPLRFSLAAASFAIWALAVHGLATWTATQLSGAV